MVTDGGERGGAERKQKEQAGYWLCNSPKAVKVADENDTTLSIVLHNHRVDQSHDADAARGKVELNRSDAAH